MTGLHRDRVIPTENSEELKPKKSKRGGSGKRYAFLRKIRWIPIIGLGGILTNSYYKIILTKTIYDGPLRAGCVPFLNCHACPFAISSCPIGILQHFAAIRKFPIFLIGLLGIIGITVGRAACGWLCPFGWIQDQMFKIKSKKFTLPKPLSYLKYVSLIVLAILLPYFTEAHWFSRICPWGTIIAGIPWVLWNPIDPTFAMPVIEPGMVGGLYVLKIGVLVFFLVLFVLIKRPFCRTACPLGAIYSIFNRFSLMQLTSRQSASCDKCGFCRSVCPVDISVRDDPGSPECIRCLECTKCNHVRVKWGFGHDG
jgi:polyferredoxin